MSDPSAVSYMEEHEFETVEITDESRVESM